MDKRRGWSSAPPLADVCPLYSPRSRRLPLLLRRRDDLALQQVLELGLLQHGHFGLARVLVLIVQQAPWRLYLAHGPAGYVQKLGGVPTGEARGLHAFADRARHGERSCRSVWSVLAIVVPVDCTGAR